MVEFRGSLHGNFENHVQILFQNITVVLDNDLIKPFSKSLINFPKSEGTRIWDLAGTRTFGEKLFQQCFSKSFYRI
jgi:hypothetical protein